MCVTTLGTRNVFGLFSQVVVKYLLNIIIVRMKVIVKCYNLFIEGIYL